MINDSLNDQLIFPTNHRQQYSTSRTWRRSFRKRRANSDSELPLPVLDYVSNGISDDSVIDFLGDSSMDKIDHLMSSKATMDPSQMFIGGSKNKTNDLESVILNANDIPTLPDNVQNKINDLSTANGLPNNLTNAIFSAQIIYVDNLPPGVDAALVEKITTTNPIVENNFTSDANEAALRHIPAKYRKSNVPVQLLSNPLMTSQDKEDYDINKQWVTNRADKEELKERGVEWKNGIWSTEEEEILRTNIDSYCEKNNIVDPTLMIFSSKDMRKHFYRSISKGLNRTLFAVYRKVTRMYDDRNYVGRYTKEQEVRLMELCDELKCDWIAIGHALGRSPASVKDKARLLRNKKNKGKWSDDELERLSKAVHKLTNTKVGECVTVGISWTNVAVLVDTRNEKQCFNKWLNYLNWKEAGGKNWIKTDEIELINRVANTGETEERKLDWHEISNGWPSVRSPQWLRNKWWNIKKNVPGYKIKSFPDLLLYLKGPYIDSIWGKCKESMLAQHRNGLIGKIDNPGPSPSIEDSGTPMEDSGTPIQDSGTLIEDSGTLIEDSGTPVGDSETPVEDQLPGLSAFEKHSLNPRVYSSYSNLDYQPLELNSIKSNNLLLSTTPLKTTHDKAKLIDVGMGVSAPAGMNMNMFDNSGMECLQQAIKAVNSLSSFDSSTSLSVVAGSDRMISDLCDDEDDTPNSPLFQDS